MKLMKSNLRFILFIAIEIIVENLASAKNQNEMSDENAHLICKEEWRTVNCSNSTCVGYKICSQDSMREVENTPSSCLCRFYDANGIYTEAKNCMRRYSILNGVCYSNSNGYKFCICKKGWIGNHCEIKLLKKDSNSKEDHIKNMRYSFPVIFSECEFTDNDGKPYKGKCANHMFVAHGECWLPLSSESWRCKCVNGWSGITDCNTLVCINLNNCNEHGSCIWKDNLRVCDCQNGWFGPSCENLCSGRCENGDKFYDHNTNICDCICDPDYQPPDCKNRKTSPATTKTLTTTTPSTTYTTPNTTTTKTDPPPNTPTTLTPIIISRSTPSLTTINTYPSHGDDISIQPSSSNSSYYLNQAIIIVCCVIGGVLLISIILIVAIISRKKKNKYIIQRSAIDRL